MLESFNILGVFIADFAAGIAAECHFAYALLKGVFRTEIGKVVICPCDRGYRKIYLVFVKHL